MKELKGQSRCVKRYWRHGKVGMRRRTGNDSPREYPSRPSLVVESLSDSKQN